MKHTLLLAAIVLLSLAGCTRGIQTGTTSHAGSVPLNEGSDIGYSYSYSMEYLTGGLPQDVMDAINGGIVRSFILFGQEDAGTDVKAACRQWEESGIAGYKSDAEQMLDDFDEESSFMLNWESGIDGRFLPPDAKRN